MNLSYGHYEGVEIDRAFPNITSEKQHYNESHIKNEPIDDKSLIDGNIGMVAKDKCSIVTIIMMIW